MESVCPPLLTRNRFPLPQGALELHQRVENRFPWGRRDGAPKSGTDLSGENLAARGPLCRCRQKGRAYCVQVVYCTVCHLNVRAGEACTAIRKLYGTVSCARTVTLAGEKLVSVSLCSMWFMLPTWSLRKFGKLGVSNLRLDRWRWAAKPNFSLLCAAWYYIRTPG